MIFHSISALTKKEYVSMQVKGSVRLVEILIIIVVLFGWGAMLYKAAIEDELSPFNPMKYGFLIFLFAMPVYIIISPKRKLNEWICLWLIIFGMFSLCQPFTIFLYRCGFQTIIIGTLGFIFISHLKPIKS